MEYELYWNTNGSDKVSGNMVISGSFATLTNARAYAYSEIEKTKVSTNLLKKSSKIIEILGIDRDGHLFDCGKVGTMDTSKGKYVAYKPYGKKGTYRLASNGSIRR